VWGALTIRFWSMRWDLKQSHTPHQEISNNMWHTFCTHVTQGDFWLLMVKNQIDILTLDPSFSYNLCYKYSNRSCKPILNIYVLKTFQWYKEIFNQMNFDLSNFSLKNLKVYQDFNSQNESPFGNVWAHSLTLSYTSKSVNVTIGLHSRPTPFHGLALFVNLRLGLWQVLQSLVRF
jgi:hypothetical protein